jgi:rubrerythrin
MSHHHPHDHHHGHDHTHSHDHSGNDHHHGHSNKHAPLSFSEKLEKLLNHWIQHNDHHIGDYQKWAQEARENSQTEVADLLESAAELTDAISDRFREATKKVKQE